MICGKTKKYIFPLFGFEQAVPVHVVGSNPGKRDSDVNTANVWMWDTEVV